MTRTEAIAQQNLIEEKIESKTGYEVEWVNYKAVDVLHAAKKTYDSFGSHDYAAGKANGFLKRCGAKLEHGPEQLICKPLIELAVYAMLDADMGELFWKSLNSRLEARADE